MGYTEADPLGLAAGWNRFGYAAGDALSYIDPKGLDISVTIWQPVGWGASSFGHVSTDINGTTYSFGPSGMSVIPTPEYVKRNEFRNGMAVNLKLTPEQEAAIQACISKPQRKYSINRNNCGSPIQDCLKVIGVDLNNSVLPVSLGEKLLKLEIFNGVTDYPASNPSKKLSAPWAK